MAFRLLILLSKSAARLLALLTLLTLLTLLPSLACLLSLLIPLAWLRSLLRAVHASREFFPGGFFLSFKV